MRSCVWALREWVTTLVVATIPAAVGGCETQDRSSPAPPPSTQAASAAMAGQATPAPSVSVDPRETETDHSSAAEPQGDENEPTQPSSPSPPAANHRGTGKAAALGKAASSASPTAVRAPPPKASGDWQDFVAPPGSEVATKDSRPDWDPWEENEKK